MLQAGSLEMRAVNQVCTEEYKATPTTIVFVSANSVDNFISIVF